MKISYCTIWDPNNEVEVDITKSPMYVGRDSKLDVSLQSPLVPLSAGAFVFQDDKWHFESQCRQVKVNNRVLKPGERLPVDRRTLIEINPYFLKLLLPNDASVATETSLSQDLELNLLVQKIHEDLLKVVDVSNQSHKRTSPDFIRLVEETIEKLAIDRGLLTEAHSKTLSMAAGYSVKAELLDRVEQVEQQSSIWDEGELWVTLQTASVERERDLRKKVDSVQSRLEQQIARAAATTNGVEQDKFELISEFFWGCWNEVAGKSLPASLEYIGLRFFKKQIKDILFGYGPLQDLLRSPGVSEIMVIDSNNIYVERNNRLKNSGRKFVSDDATLHVIQRIVQKAEREINFANPLVDARLDDGSRVHAAVKPIAVRGPCLTIRKFPKHRFTIEQLIEKRTITTPVKNFLAACVRNKCNILISGGTGSGKTTLLNCLTSFFGDDERIVTIEDTAELQVQKKHVVTLETKSASRSGTGAITIADLVRNSLRMRPSRIIVGETRGAEALDMLQALNTGHSGSLTTIHSNSTQDAVSRLEVLVSQASDSLPLPSIRQQIVSAIDLIVQIKRLEDHRAVTEIAEVVELDDQTGEIRLRKLFQTYRDTKDIEENESGTELSETGCTYSLLPTGGLPTFVGELIAKGLLDVKAFFE